MPNNDQNSSWNGPERRVRKSNHVRPHNLSQEAWRNWVDDQLIDGAEQFRLLTEQTKANAELIAANTELTEQIKKDTGAIVASWKALDGFVRIMSHISTILKWIVGIVAPIGAIWAWVKYGQWPK
jgi:hypothetical protein